MPKMNAIYIMEKIDVFGTIIVIFILLTIVYIYFDSDTFQLKCIVSTVDGNKYCVRERERMQEAADLLASTTEKSKTLVNFVSEKYPNNEAVRRLVNGYNPQRIVETLPTSQYTAYSENKGEKLAFCLNKKKGENGELIDEHTLMFVTIHELSHVMTKSIGHKTEFWDNFKFLLEEAKSCGIHDPEDYNKRPKEYCSMKITDNPYYDA